jgi:tetratricopeptide (TPR) repeat protein
VPAAARRAGHDRPGAIAVPAGTVSLLSVGTDATSEAAGLLPVARALAASHAGSLAPRQVSGAGLVVAFARARDAASCALALQRALVAGPAGPPIALHTGEADHAADGLAAGPAVSHCGCLQRCAFAGQLVVSQSSASLLSGQLPERAILTSLGWHRLPDLGPAEQLWQLSPADTRREFPPLRSLDPSRHNLPVQLASFIGRRDELAEVTSLLRTARLVTRTGRAAAARRAGDGFFLSFCLVALVHSRALLGQFEEAEAACRELDAIGEAMGSARLYFAAEARGWLAFCRGQWPQAVTAFREQLGYYASVALRGMWTGNLAWAEFRIGRRDTARRRLDDFIAESDPDRTCLALPLAVRALICQSDAEPERAAELAADAVAASPADPFGQLTMWACLAVLASIKADGGSPEVAARLAGATAAFARDMALARLPAHWELIDSAARACRATLGDDQFGRAWAEGNAMTLADAVAYASRGRGKRVRPTAAGRA